MSLKSISRTGSVCWCPVEDMEEPMFAVGNVGGEGNDQFSSNSFLEIMTLGAANSQEFEVVASLAVSSRFRSLVWTALLPESFPCGLIVGGMEDGTLRIWDANEIFNGSASSEVFCGRVSSGVVSCMDAHKKFPNQLAVGTTDGEVIYLDLSSVQQPSVFPFPPKPELKGVQINVVQWHRDSAGIIASCSSSGVVQVLECKNMGTIVQFKDPANRSGCSGIWWHQNRAQLIISYNDENNPSLQFWNLKGTGMPSREQSCHNRGVLSIASCPQDSSLVATSGKDGKVLCWTAQGSQMLEIYAEICTSTSANSLSWCPTRPGLLLSSSLSSSGEGSISLLSLNSGRMTPSSNKHPPAWIAKPCAVSFGFGGKLVMASGKKVLDFTVSDEQCLVAEADRFEHYMATNDLLSFCETQMDLSEDQHERLTWSLMKLHMEKKGDDKPEVRRERRRGEEENRGRGKRGAPQILRAFGFEPGFVNQQAEQFLGRPLSLGQEPREDGPTEAPSQQVEEPEASEEADHDFIPEGEVDDFFDNLAKNQAQIQEQEAQQMQQGHASPLGLRSPTGTHIEEEVIDWAGPMSVIKQALLVGNLSAAVECCLKAGRMADALLLAAGGGGKLWEDTRKAYMKKQSDPFLKMIGYMLTNDLPTMLKKSDLSQWPETLAFLATYADPQDFPGLVGQLAERLEKEVFDSRGAVLCFLAAGNFEDTVRIWSSMPASSASQATPALALQGLVEKMAVFKSALAQKRGVEDSDIFSARLTQYAEKLANSGRVTAAMRLLVLLKQDPSSQILRDRIYNNAPTKMHNFLASPPQFPFAKVDLTSTQQPQRAPAVAMGKGKGMGGKGGMGGMGYQPHQAHHAQHPPHPHQAQHPPHPHQGHGYGHGQYGGPPPAGNRGMGFQAPGPTPPPYPGHSQHQAHQPPPPLSSSQGPSRMSSAGKGGPPSLRMHGAGGHVGAVPPSPHSMSQGHSFGGHATPQSHGFAMGQQTQPPSAAPTYTPNPRKPVSRHLPAGAGRAMTPPVHSAPMGQMHAAGPPRASTPPAMPSHPMHGMSPSGRGSMGSQGRFGMPQGPPPPSPGPIQGPPTSGGVSTAPQASARSTTGNLPVSWPVPNPQEAQRWHNPATAEANRVVAGTAGAQAPPMPMQEVEQIRGVFGQCLARIHDPMNPRKAGDISKKLEDLFVRLAEGRMMEQTISQVRDMAKAVERGDISAALKIQAEISTRDWDNNKSWLLAAKRVMMG